VCSLKGKQRIRCSQWVRNNSNSSYGTVFSAPGLKSGFSRKTKEGVKEKEGGSVSVSVVQVQCRRNPDLEGTYHVTAVVERKELGRVERGQKM
jgi:hypothetical protein